MNIVARCAGKGSGENYLRNKYYVAIDLGGVRRVYQEGLSQSQSKSVYCDWLAVFPWWLL